MRHTQCGTLHARQAGSGPHCTAAAWSQGWCGVGAGASSRSPARGARAGGTGEAVLAGANYVQSLRRGP
jgi:hypothetical protein